MFVQSFLEDISCVLSQAKYQKCQCTLTFTMVRISVANSKPDFNNEHYTLFCRNFQCVKVRVDFIDI